MEVLKLSLIVCFLHVTIAHQANILIVSMLTSHSHHFWNEAVALGLVDKGHNVTMLTHDISKVEHQNFTVITLEGISEKFDKMYTIDFLTQFRISAMNIPRFVQDYFDFELYICQLDIKHPTLQTALLKGYPDDFKFDLILWDHTAGSCLYPLIERFGNPPIMGLSPFGLTNTVEDIYGSNVYSYVGQVSMPFVEAVTIWDRLLNVLYIIYSYYFRRTYFKPKSVDLARTFFPEWNLQKYDAVEEKFSVCLLNWNIAVHQAQPLAPNFIPVGGVQIKTNTQLPKEFQEIFNKTKSGVIYFSMGSNVRCETLSINALQVMANCFEGLPDYTVIWKLKPPVELKLPENVHAVAWAPQTAILSEEKTQLFISHGGGLSTQETSFFGVPILGIPVFLDQVNNVHKLQLKGGAEFVDIGHLIKAAEKPNKLEANQLFCGQVKKMLQNPTYGELMRKTSLRYRDLPIKPLEAAVYWTEYVLRHDGAQHLNPIAREFNGFKSQNLDLYMIVICVVVFLVVFLVLLFKALIRIWTFYGSATKVKIN